jgi:hypothetical protein
VAAGHLSAALQSLPRVDRPAVSGPLLRPAHRTQAALDSSFTNSGSATRGNGLR